MYLSRSQNLREVCVLLDVGSSSVRRPLRQPHVQEAEDVLQRAGPGLGVAGEGVLEAIYNQLTEVKKRTL